MNSLVTLHYQPKILPARERFSQRPVLKALLAHDIKPELLERFLINFCAFGVRMTEPVESWCTRAGARCEELGLDALGRSLKAHAKHEAGHHTMMIDDTRLLVSRHNERSLERLDADDILAAPPTPGVRAYVALHEATIAGSAPFGQLGIEYEIEGLSVRVGPAILRQCAAKLGNGVIEGLSFLAEHVAIDEGHTKFNEKQLERLLMIDLGYAEPVAAAGAAALDAYAAYLSECYEQAAAAIHGAK